MNDTVRISVAAGVATLQLNRPAQLNALSSEMMQGLRAAAEQATADPSVHVIVIEGAGSHFMAGGDIREFHSHLHLDAAARLETFRAMIEQWINPAIAALRNAPQPVIAKVRGACAGFGLSLMLACDLALAAEDAVFTTAYAQIALAPDGAQSWFLPRIAGSRKAAELLLLSERLSAAQALELGLVNRVVPGADLDAAVAAIAARLANGPRQAYAEMKRLLQSTATSTLAEQSSAEALAFARCAATGDFTEGITAFLDKRKPSFKGR
ncbi:MAG: enoyl-CoA hydratase/isomerase family protein [Rhodocyclaceae bacterium]|nr:enoyl-CoA hydratase/isomerase family protein [Rhodocyclaceae bacterium]MBX3667253.1 enoyl-CoA hydratase/isomerase family protein [Rhodocyclaceae bacterium]